MNRVLSTKAFILSHLSLLVLSLILLTGIYYVLNQDAFLKSVVQEYLPVTTSPVSFNLEINSPDDDLLTFDRSIVISGQTTSRASVVISSPEFDTGLETTPNGDFSKVVSLEEGINNLTITAFNNAGDAKSVLKNIYYSKEKLEE